MEAPDSPAVRAGEDAGWSSSRSLHCGSRTAKKRCPSHRLSVNTRLRGTKTEQDDRHVPLRFVDEVADRVPHGSRSSKSTAPPTRRRADSPSPRTGGLGLRRCRSGARFHVARQQYGGTRRTSSPRASPGGGGDPGVHASILGRGLRRANRAPQIVRAQPEPKCSTRTQPIFDGDYSPTDRWAADQVQEWDAATDATSLG